MNMLPEKHDKLSGLQKKLAELDDVPGEAHADYPALWEKLHQRLENKPKKPHALLYWAAACLLFIVGTVYMQRSKHDDALTAVTKRQSSKAAQPHNAKQAITPPVIIIRETSR